MKGSRILVDHEGRSVRLTDERSIHILGHPEMKGMEGEIATTLGNPQVVVQSRTDSNARIHHRQLPETRFGAKWLAVVSIVRGDDAFVVTAYLTDKPKRGTVLWPSE